MRIKMKDVAAAAGVSTMTVSRALRKDGRIAPDTRKQILGVIERLGYVPDQIAASFSSQRSGFVAVLVPSLNNPHFAETVQAIIETLEVDGTQVLLGQTNYLPEREERIVLDLLRRRPEAIVLTADAHSARTRKLLGDSGIPVVEIWDLPPHPIDHQVGFSNFAAARAMVTFLAGRGYRRIVYVGETHDAGTRGARRREGYTAGLQEMGLGPPRVHLQSAPPVSMTEGGAAFHAVRQKWPDADAVMCVSDPCAFGFMMQAIQSGLSIPRDLGIVGFGDFEVSRCSAPPLTTVGVDAVQLGLMTAKLLQERDDLRSGPARLVEIPFRVIERGSTPAAAV
jgi:LacI family transcriptional regulator, gluconate utilization system Gnt-I transcriptional repressor